MGNRNLVKIDCHFKSSSSLRIDKIYPANKLGTEDMSTLELVSERRFKSLAQGSRNMVTKCR